MHKTRRIPQPLQNKIIALRQKGLNRYEIHAELRQNIQNLVPCPSTIYNVCKRYGLNRKTPTMKKKAQMIIKEKAGMMGHVDCHYLPKGIIYQKGLLKMIVIAIIWSLSSIVKAVLRGVTLRGLSWCQT